MRAVIFVSLFIVLASARPDVSHLKNTKPSGYTYDKPYFTDNSYGLETPYVQYKPILQDNTQVYTTGTQFVQKPIGSSQFISTSGQQYGTTFTQNPLKPQHFTNVHHETYFPSGQTVIRALLQKPITTYRDEPLSHITVIKNQRSHNIHTGQTFHSELPVISLYDDSYKPGKVQYDNAFVEPIVSRNYYVHSAQRDEVSDLGTQYINIDKPQVDQRVVFIQTPSYQTKQEIVPVLPKHDEKTAIYVFNKKPTFDTTIKVEENEPVEPKNPDVFFIKYRTPEEAAQAQKQIQATYENPSAVLNTVNRDEFSSLYGHGGVGSIPRPTQSTILSSTSSSAGFNRDTVIPHAVGNVQTFSNVIKPSHQTTTITTTTGGNQQQHHIVPQKDVTVNYITTSNQEYIQKPIITQQSNIEYLPPVAHH